MSSHTPPTPTGSEDDRSTAGARPADAPVASGWFRQPLSAYESGDSGGWGGPNSGSDTGPIPRIRHGVMRTRSGRTVQTSRAATATAPANAAPARESVSSAAPRRPAEIPRPAPASAAAPAAAAAARNDARQAQNEPHEARSTGGFSRYVAARLAPIAFWLVVAYLLLDFVQALFFVAAGGPPATLVGGLVKVVALACLARVVLETCDRLVRSRRSP